MIVTFYSYKTEVGCTTTAVNAGILLCRKFSKRVLVVDLNFAEPKLGSKLKEISPAPTVGLINILIDYQQAVENNIPLDKNRLLDNLARVNSSKIKGFDFLPVFAESDENENILPFFGWTGFYKEYKGGAVIEYLREIWSASYDFVLVIGGKRFTDTAAISTVQLADTVLLTMDNNPIEVERFVKLVEFIRTSGIKADNRQIFFLPLLNKVAVEDPALRMRFRQIVESDLKKYFPNDIFNMDDYLDEVQIHNVPYMHCDDKITVLHEKDNHVFSLSRRYTALAKCLIELKLHLKSS